MPILGVGFPRDNVSVASADRANVVQPIANITQPSTVLVPHVPKLINSTLVYLDTTNTGHIIIDRAGAFLQCNFGTSSNAVMEIRMELEDGQLSDWFIVKRGIGWSGLPYRRIEGKWQAQAGEYFQFIHCMDYASSQIVFQ